eukprot:TRINITY_DN21389_c0_g1_i1.p1 TRINITY_DN21389_c0_g1~~TRINITY_DN21389_c0_g1_i1.p1  ORF type:complete len:140 (-),score=28.96 TRINITY_DN21389_c0_g1_i1:53-472(-)
MECSTDDEYYLYETRDTCELINSDCDDGFFKVQNKKECRVCDTSKCVTCSERSTYCTECQPPNEYLYSGDCFSACGKKKYALTDKTCAECPVECAECVSDVHCTACEPGTFLNGVKCDTTCPDGTYPSCLLYTSPSPRD